MASPCIRSFTRTSLSLSKAAAARSSASSFIKGSPASSPSLRRRFASISWLPVELGCLGGGSMYPLHSAVAASRLTSRLGTASSSCRDLSQGLTIAGAAVVTNEMQVSMQRERFHLAVMMDMRARENFCFLATSEEIGESVPR